MTMIEEKVKGREISVAPQSLAPRVGIDLMAALKREHESGAVRKEENGRGKAPESLMAIILLCL